MNVCLMPDLMDGYSLNCICCYNIALSNTNILFTNSTKQLYTDEDGEDPKVQRTIYTDDMLEESIDYLLKTMDINNDGFVDYTEYRNH